MSGRWGLSNPVSDAGIESAERLPTSRGFAFRAAAGEALDTTVTALLGREAERQAANIARAVDAQSIYGPSYDPVITPEEANDRFGMEGLTFDAPLPESRAAELAEIRRLENARRSAMASSDAGMLTLLGGGLAGSLADPIGIAVSVLPGGAAARMVPGVRGLASSTALSSRVSVGALEGVAAGAAMEAIIYPLATERERRDYTVADSLMNLALSGGFGAAGGAVRGLTAGRGAQMARAGEGRERGEAAEAEPVSPAQLQARQRAFVSAMADIAEDEPVSRAQDILDAAEPEIMQSQPVRPGAPLSFNRDGQGYTADFLDEAHRRLFELGLAAERGDAGLEGEATALLDHFRRFAIQEGGGDGELDMRLRDAQSVIEYARGYVEDAIEDAVPGERLIVPHVLDEDGFAAYLEEYEVIPRNTPVRLGSGRVRPDVTAALQAQSVLRHRPVHDSLAVTARGRRVPVRYAIVEAGDLIPSQLPDGRVNPDFPEVLQPRDRSRSDMQLQVDEIARGLDALRLSETFDAGQGAPVIGPDGVVESGNGRSLAIQAAYARYPDQAAQYRDFLQQAGYPVDGMDVPVLVRIRGEDMDVETRAQFAREANERTAAAMSGSEQAAADAAQITPDLFDLYQGGDAGLAKNRDFARAFIDRVATRNDRNALVDAKGALSGDGLRRLNDAIAAYAYRDIDALMRLVEGEEPGLKGLAGALRDAAPEIAALRAMIDRGKLTPGQDLGPHLVEALQVMRQARNNPLGVEGVLDNVDAFRGVISDRTVAMLHLFHNDADFSKISSRVQITELLETASRVTRESAEDDLLGARPDVQPQDAAVEAIAAIERRFRSEGRDERARQSAAIATAIRARRRAAAESGEIRSDTGGEGEFARPGRPAGPGDAEGLEADGIALRDIAGTDPEFEAYIAESYPGARSFTLVEGDAPLAQIVVRQDGNRLVVENIFDVRDNAAIGAKSYNQIGVARIRAGLRLLMTKFEGVTEIGGIRVGGARFGGEHLGDAKLGRDVSVRVERTERNEGLGDGRDPALPDPVDIYRLGDLPDQQWEIRPLADGKGFFISHLNGQTGQRSVRAAHGGTVRPDEYGRGGDYRPRVFKTVEAARDWAENDAFARRENRYPAEWAQKNRVIAADSRRQAADRAAAGDQAGADEWIRDAIQREGRAVTLERLAKSRADEPASPVRPPEPEAEPSGTLFDDPGLQYLADDVDALEAQLRQAEAQGLIDAEAAADARAADGNTNPDDVYAAFDRAVRCLTGKGV